MLDELGIYGGTGDIHTVKPVDPLTIQLPWSPYYPGLTFAKAIRNGNEVTITWAPLELRAGDSSEQEPYLLETWVCRDGKLTFVPIGAYETIAKVVDQEGCSEPSSWRVYGWKSTVTPNTLSSNGRKLKVNPINHAYFRDGCVPGERYLI